MIANINDKISDRDLLYEAKLCGKIPELMQGILRRKVIDSHIQQAGIELTTADLQAAADKFRIVNQLESAETTKEWLAQRFLSLDDFEDLVTHNTISHKLAEHLFNDRVEQVFHQNILDYSLAIVYEVILEDYDLAMEIYYSLQEGDLSFTDVAHQYIPIPELRRRGGYVGKVGRKQLRPELSAAIFAATPPQLLKPIVTAVGIHLIQVEEIIEPQLDEELRQEILSDLFEQWLAEQIAAQPKYHQPFIGTIID
jgi:parvulin-like peptidyl-prolyl isomerase